MEVLTRHEGNCLEFFLKGELDHHGAQGLLLRLEQDIQKALPMVLILDFTDVTFMDSSGIALLMRAKRCMDDLDGGLLVCRVRPQVKRVMDAAGIGRLIHIRQEESE